MTHNITEVAKAISTIKTSGEIEQFLNEILTENELKTLSLRWKLMKQLKEGYTQRAIASNLHISLCKVTRGNRILKDSDTICNHLLNSMEE